MLEVKLTRENPRMCLFLTEQKAFVELYIPGRRGGACEIIEVQRSVSSTEMELPMFRAIRSYFEGILTSQSTVTFWEAMQPYCQTHTSEDAKLRGRALDKYIDRHGSGSEVSGG